MRLLLYFVPGKNIAVLTFLQTLATLAAELTDSEQARERVSDKDRKGEK